MYIFEMLDVLEERKCGALVEHMPNEQGHYHSGSRFIVQDCRDHSARHLL